MIVIVFLAGSVAVFMFMNYAVGQLIDEGVISLTNQQETSNNSSDVICDNSLRDDTIIRVHKFQREEIIW